MFPQNELTDKMIAAGNGDKIKPIECQTTRRFKKYGVLAAIFNFWCAFMYDYIEITEQ